MCTLMGPRWRLLYPGGRLGRRDARVWSAQGLQRQCCRVDAQESLKSVGTQPGEGQAPRVGGPAGLGPTENPLGWAALVGGLRGHSARGGLADDDQLPQQANVSTPQGTVGTADLCTLFPRLQILPGSLSASFRTSWLAGITACHWLIDDHSVNRPFTHHHSPC